MDVLAQALNVVARASGATGRVWLTLDLDEPAHRAAYAAAIAVLEVSGVETASVVRAADAAGADVPGTEARGGAFAGPGSVPTLALHADAEGSADTGERDAELCRQYAAALAELTPDEARQAAALEDTFGRVRELLRDGANVTAVAQIQYQRWLEEHRDAARPG